MGYVLSFQREYPHGETAIGMDRRTAPAGSSRMRHLAVDDADISSRHERELRGGCQTSISNSDQDELSVKSFNSDGTSRLVSRSNERASSCSSSLKERIQAVRGRAETMERVFESSAEVRDG